MDCPTCGLVNPPGGIKCDCGYDFEKSEPSATPGRMITLTWSQRIAAYWAISWPALVATFIAGFVIGPGAPAAGQAGSESRMTLITFVAFFGTQALLTRRLIRKKFRTFRVYVIRSSGQAGGSLSMLESFRVWLWIFGPQLALLAGYTVFTQFYGSKLPPQLLRGLTSAAIWLRFLAVGPYAIGPALGVRHKGFRLQAYAYHHA
jgi:hypothetical protein